MANYTEIKQIINANIKANNNQEITGPILNSVLNSMVNSLGGNIDSVESYSPVLVLRSLSVLNPIPNVDTSKAILDLGPDPVVFSGTKSYVLKDLMDEDQFRSIDLSYKTSSAVCVLFNTSNNTIYTKEYIRSRSVEELLLCVYRIDQGNNIYGFSAFFDYTVNGVAVVNGVDTLDDYAAKNFLFSKWGLIVPCNARDILPANINTENKTLNLYKGCVVVYGTKYYVLPNYISIDLTEGLKPDPTNQLFLVKFDTDKNTFSVSHASLKILKEEIIIGTIVIKSNAQGEHYLSSWEFNFDVTVNNNSISLTTDELYVYDNDRRVAMKYVIDASNIRFVNISMKSGYRAAVVGYDAPTGFDANSLVSTFDSGWVINGSVTIKNNVSPGAIFFRFSKSNDGIITAEEVIENINFIGFVFGSNDYNNTKEISYLVKNKGIILSQSGYDRINIDLNKKIIDFTSDPVFFVNSKSYVLQTLDPERTYRAVPFDNSVTGLILILFNVRTAKIRTIAYNRYAYANYLYDKDDFVIGSMRYDSTGRFFGANFAGGTLYRISGHDVPMQNNRAIHIDRGIKIIAHRGYHLQDVPENSIDAYRLAGQFGYDIAETDFCPTSDGVLVLMHDASINRTMRNKSDYSEITETVNVIDHTYEDLKNNYVFASENPLYRRPIPTLEEYFKVCREYGIFPLPEIKRTGTTEADIKKAYDLGCEIIGEGGFGFCSFSYEFLDYVRTLSKKTPLYYIGDSILGTTNSKNSESREYHLNVWYPDQSYVNDEATVREYRKKGMKIAVWTVSKWHFHKWANLGVDVASDDMAPTPKFHSGAMSTRAKDFPFAITGEYEMKDGAVLLKTGANIVINFPQMEKVANFAYFVVEFKGDIKVLDGYYTGSLQKDDFYRYYFQGFMNSDLGQPYIYITANADTTINFIDILALSY